MDLLVDKEVELGDKVSFRKGSICTTYPLNDFKNYKGEDRDNTITNGVVIDKTHKYALLPTVLVKDNDKVVCVRCC